MTTLHSFLGMSALATMLCANAQAQDEKLIVGQWRLSNASIAIPAECKQISYRFNGNGTSEGTDGFSVMSSRYRVTEATDGGLTIHWTYVSDNGRPSCQGNSAEFMRQHAIKRSLVFVNGQDELLMYFGESRDLPYMVLVRTK